MSEKIKVLIIDDSAMVRKIFSEEISKDNMIEVVGTAPDPVIGRDKIVYLKPDVVLLDVEMPKMDGLTFLEKLMKHYPIPVIIVSSIAKAGSDVALRALELGAVDVISKPGSSYSVKDMGEQLIEKIKAAKGVKKLRAVSFKPSKEKIEANKNIVVGNKIIAIGASTGGTEAIKDVLINLPPNMPPIVIVQHMPENFTASFAARLNSLCSLNVKEAKNGDLALPGLALLAPGNKHMVLKYGNRGYYVEIKDGPLIFHQRPAVEILFRSVAKYAGKNAIGLILTGMGKDGAEGLLEMKNNGAYTIAQNKETCVVFGMPKEAISMGGVQKILALDKISIELIKKSSR